MISPYVKIISTPKGQVTVMEFKLKFLPSTEKCFIDESIDDKYGIESLSMLRNERLGFQLAYATEDLWWVKKSASLEVVSDIKDAVSLYRIEQVPVTYPKDPGAVSEGYLRDTPGLYPDLLIPFEERYKFIFHQSQLRSLFVIVENKEGLPAGDHYITFRALDGDNCLAEATMKIKVIDALLPKQSLIHTEWFHTDGLSQYYEAEIYSDRYWEILRSFLSEARETGVNMILTPVFTPPLDTDIGGERMTSQLVDVNVENGKYSFGYERFDKWVKLCLELGFEYFEISHLFTQWGCLHAPKVMATVDGEYKKIFGWDTDAHADEYRTFVRAFLTDFVSHAKELGIDEMCYYHISDEPYEEHLESYLDAKNMIWDIVGKYHVIDALSDYQYYERGAVEHPIPASDHIEPFLENKVPELWTYYCVSQCDYTSNRFISMPGTRTRAIGVQLFKFNIVGFLHWGFNFYNCQFSNYPINPYNEMSGEFWATAGDPFLVYPGPHGKPYRSLHGMQFYDALTDLRALQYLSSLIGKEEAMRLVEEECKAELRFTYCPLEQSYYVNLREKVNAAIENALK